MLIACEAGFANTSESNEESMTIIRRAFPGGPWDFETRITRLFNEAVPDLKPDFIQVSAVRPLLSR